MDLYYLAYRRKDATFDQDEGCELRHSWGARLWKVSGAFDYNVEAVAQTASFGNARIRAWTMASDTGYRLTLAGHRSASGPTSRAVTVTVTTIGWERSTRCFQKGRTSG